MIPTERNKRLIFFFLLLGVAIVYFVGLFIDITRDAAKYAFISKEISQTGHWLNLQIQGEAYNQKPHFMFWLSAISFKIFVISNFSFKLPILLYSGLGIFAVYKLGESLFNRTTGKIAATMLGFSLVMFLFNMDLHTDTVLQTNVAIALWLLYEYLKNDKFKYLLGAGLALGLALLTKGPIGVVVPFFATTGYLIANKKYKKLFHWHWAILLFIAFIVSSPAWYNYYYQWHWKGIYFFLWTNTVGRITGSYAGNTADPFFYIHNLLYLLLPWTFVFFAAAYNSIRKQFRSKLKPEEQFLFWGFWIFFLLISISKSKLPNYIQSVLPLIAIFTAREWEQVFNRTHPTKKYLIIQNSAIGFIWFAVCTLFLFFLPTKNPVIYGSVILGFLLFEYLIFKWPTKNKIWYRSLFSAVILGLLLNMYILPYLFGQQAQPQAAKALNKLAKKEAVIYNLDINSINGKVENKDKIAENPELHHDPFAYEKHAYLNFELIFYCNQKVYDIDSYTQTDSIIAHGNCWIYSDNKGYDYLVNKKSAVVDTVFSYNHFDLRRSARFINPLTRESAFEKKYLFHLSTKKK